MKKRFYLAKIAVCIMIVCQLFVSPISVSFEEKSEMINPFNIAPNGEHEI